MKTIPIGAATNLYFGSDLLDCLPRICAPLRPVVAVDEAIRELYGAKIGKLVNAPVIGLPSGEKAKTRETVAYLVDALSELDCGRDTVLIGLGGGAATDLVGFVASIYMRGIPLVLVPTTLLAIVDAAIGGKSAIDTPYGKNIMGTFYPPKAIVSDLRMLDSLPEKEWLNGLAEIWKMGLIRDGSIFEGGEREVGTILKAIEGKIGIVEQDPTEQSIRRILNFGHTIGHGLEKGAEYQIAHGEAVALGSLVEAHLSAQLGYLAGSEFERIKAIYRRFPLKLPRGYRREKLIEAMGQDKKRAEGKIRFVLIDQIGRTIPFDGAYCRAVSEKEFAPSLDWMEGSFL